MIGSLWRHIVSSSLAWHIASIDCQVNVTIQLFLPGLLCCLSSAYLMPSQGRSLPVNIFLLLSRHVTCHQVQVQSKLYWYDVTAISHVACYTSWVRYTQYGVTTQHCSTTNGVGMHVNTLRGAHLRSPNNLCAMESWHSNSTPGSNLAASVVLVVSTTTPLPPCCMLCAWTTAVVSIAPCRLLLRIIPPGLPP